MFGSGKTLYHPLYVENLVDAHILAMEPGKGDGQTYLIADEEYVTIENRLISDHHAQRFCFDVNLNFRPSSNDLNPNRLHINEFRRF